MSPATPRILPPRRRSGDSGSWKLKLVIGIIGLAGTAVSGYTTAMVAIGDRERALLERIVKLETQRESENKAIIARLDELKTQMTEQRQDTRADINRIRDEMIRILRNMR